MEKENDMQTQHPTTHMAGDTRTMILESCRLSIIKGVVFSLLTCGLYNIYWQYLQINTVNTLLGRQEFSFARWFVFSLLTCGLYHIYWEYIFGQGIDEVQAMHNTPVRADNLPLLSVILSLVGLSLIADAIQQREINNTIDTVLAG
jgi:hypothetical protein